VTAGVPGNIDSDTIVLLNGGRAPVLAHRLLNHILDSSNAMTNFTTCTGYQMPQNSMALDSLTVQGPAPEHLANVYLAEDDFDRGSRQLELSPAGDVLWRDAYIAVAEEDI
jgi:spermidine/putrescine-binding protein